MRLGAGRRVFVLLLALALAVAPYATAARTAGKGAAAGPVVLHPHFHKVGSAAYVVTNGRYVYFSSVSSPAAPAPSATLIDERTGRRTDLPAINASLTGRWLWWPVCTGAEFGCVPAIGMYSLASGRSLTSTITYQSCWYATTQCDFGPLGAQWIEISASCYHCTATYSLQNIWTGQVVSRPATTTQTVIDLDATSLVRRLCSPLRDAPTNQLALNAAGAPDLSGTPLGEFAVAYVPHGPPYLERCGSHLHYRLPWAPTTGNARALLSEADGGRTLNGIFLGNRRRFTIVLPKALTVRTPQDPAGSVGAVVLSSRTLWATSINDQLWAAPAPSLPRNAKH